MTQLSYEIKILCDIRSNMSLRSICKKYNISHTTVLLRFRKFRKNGENGFQMRNYFSPAHKCDELILNFKISVFTTKRYLRSLGLFGRISRRVTYIYDLVNILLLITFFNYGLNS